VFVLGCGGAGRAVALTCAAHGATRLALADVEERRCTAVAAEIAALGSEVEATVVGGGPARWPAAARAADVVVQATPVGMKPGDVCPLPPDAFRVGQWAFDLVYHIPETVFMRAARQGGATAANGLGMLLHQGARAFTIWTGRDADVEAMRRALARAVFGA
jgi:shikimate dehydrogenase